MVWARRNLKALLIPSPAMGSDTIYYPMLLQALSKPFLLVLALQALYIVSLHLSCWLQNPVSKLMVYHIVKQMPRPEVRFLVAILLMITAGFMLVF